MDLIELYDFGEDNGIYAQYTHIKSGHMAAVIDNSPNGYGIAMYAPQMIRSEMYEKIYLSHEMGHCITGALHDNSASYEEIVWCEKKSWKWVYRNVITEDEIQKAVGQGMCEIWELAEYFHVPYKFMYSVALYQKYGICQELDIQTDYSIHMLDV